MTVVVTEKSLVRGKEVETSFIQTKDAVVIIPLISADQLLLIRQYRTSVKQHLYEFPAGGIEQDEYPEHAAHRELLEETGYRAVEMNHVLAYYPTPGISTEKIHLFVARLGVQDEQQLDDAEDIEVHIFALETVRDMVKHGKIVDGKTIMGLLLLQQGINNQVTGVQE